MTVLATTIFLALFDVFYPRKDPRERGIKGWYAMRSFSHPFQVLLYGSVVWAGLPLMAAFLWWRLAA